MEYESIETAPKDGTEVYLQLSGNFKAFWDDDSKRWVLSQPLHLESISNPTTWARVPNLVKKD